MTQREQPQWQPISMLPTIARHIDGMLEADLEQYETLLEAKSRPYVLDDATVARVISVFTTQQNDFWLFEEHLQHWRAETLMVDQSLEVERLVVQMKLLRQNNKQVLALAQELAQGTIEKQLAKSDLQVGVEILRKMARGELNSAPLIWEEGRGGPVDERRVRLTSTDRDLR